MSDTRESPATVLVVEDNELIRDLCTTVLRAGGFDALAASTADEALGILHRADPQVDVLLTDLGLPGELDGRDLLAAARTLPAAPGLIIATGAIGGTGHLGNDVEVLQKPFTMDALVAAVHRARGRATA